MHSVSVCPCLSETVCAHAFCMWLHFFDMLLCPYLQMKTASSLSWGGSPMSIFKLEIRVLFSSPIIWKKIIISLGDGASIFPEGPGMLMNDGTMSWTGAGISHLSSRDVHGVFQPSKESHQCVSKLQPTQLYRCNVQLQLCNWFVWSPMIWEETC